MVQRGEGPRFGGVGMETSPRNPIHVLEDLLLVVCSFLRRNIFKTNGQGRVV